MSRNSIGSFCAPGVAYLRDRSCRVENIGMKNIMKTCAHALVAIMFLSMTGVAQAGPINWGPDTYDPANDIYFASGGAACTSQSVSATCESLLYSHDLTAYGFIPGASSLDQLTGGLLDVVFRDDESDNPNEAFRITLEGLLQPGAHDASVPFSFGGISGALLLSLQTDGVLNVLLNRQNGDFVFDSSTFTAYGTRASAVPAVPEPGSMVLFGVGLVVAARMARRRLHGHA
jgi:hypothetical protein